jgi:hypothetical protein
MSKVATQHFAAVFAVLAISTRALGDTYRTGESAIRSWAEPYRSPAAFRATWNLRVGSSQPGRNAPTAGVSLRDVSTYRWPDCFDHRRTFIELTNFQGPLDQRAAMEQGARLSLNRREVLTPSGRRVQMGDVPGVFFVDEPSFGLLRDHALEFVEDSPFLLAWWLLDVGLEDPSRSIVASGSEIVADFPGRKRTVRFTRTGDACRPLTVDAGRAVGEHQRMIRWRFEDWRPVAGGVSVPYRRTMYAANDSGAYIERRSEPLLEFVVLGSVPDDEFSIDTSKVRIADAAGVVRNADGQVVGKVRPHRVLQPALQWTVLLGSALTGLVVGFVLLRWTTPRA